MLDSMMKVHAEALLMTLIGKSATDKYTDFSGVVTAIALYSDNDIRVQLETCEDGKAVCEWFSASRLSLQK